MRVAIRADSSAGIGMGHVVRCLALAQEFIRRGADVLFVTRQDPGNGIALLDAAGISTAVLPRSDGSHTPDWASDLQETTAVLRTHCPEIAVVDSYALPMEWERGVRSLGIRLLALDDAPDRLHECDVLLDQNPGEGIEQQYRALVPARCDVLVGPKYALLREDFRRIREQGVSRELRPTRRLLLFMGGGRVEGLVARVLSEITPLAAEEGLLVDVVLGSASAAGAQLVHDWHGVDGVTVVHSVTDIARRMVEADVALGSAGSASWERCAVGLPAIVAAVAGNQERIGRELGAAGAAEYLGASPEILDGTWASSLRRLMSSPQRLADMSRCASTLVDGRGAIRVADAILGEAAQ